MTCGIYSIQRTLARRYVGSSFNIEKRWTYHKCKLRKGLHHSHALQRAWLKYGEEAFQFVILEECEREALEQREQVHMDLGAPYNCKAKAGNQSGWKPSKETRKNMSDSAKRASATPEQRAARSARAKAQHVAGRLGRVTWTRKPVYNPASAIAGAKALRAHIENQTSDEMSRRSRCRKNLK